MERSPIVRKVERPTVDKSTMDAIDRWFRESDVDSLLSLELDEFQALAREGLETLSTLMETDEHGK